MLKIGSIHFDENKFYTSGLLFPKNKRQQLVTIPIAFRSSLKNLNHRPPARMAQHVRFWGKGQHRIAKNGRLGKRKTIRPLHHPPSWTTKTRPSGVNPVIVQNTLTYPRCTFGLRKSSGVSLVLPTATLMPKMPAAVSNVIPPPKPRGFPKRSVCPARRSST